MLEKEVVTIRGISRSALDVSKDNPKGEKKKTQLLTVPTHDKANYFGKERD